MANVFGKYSDKISGTWTLISFEMFTSDGPDQKFVSKPHGDNPTGRVVISQSGYLSAILAVPAFMAPLASDDWAEATDEEVLRVSRNVTCYAGPMTLLERGDGGLLWHTQVEIANNPNWIGKQQTRLADWSEENGTLCMILRPDKWYTLEVRAWFLLTNKF